MRRTTPSASNVGPTEFGGKPNQVLPTGSDTADLARQMRQVDLDDGTDARWAGRSRRLA